MGFLIEHDWESRLRAELDTRNDLFETKEVCVLMYCLLW